MNQLNEILSTSEKQNLPVSHQLFLTKSVELLATNKSCIFFLYEMTLCNGLKFNGRTEVLLHKNQVFCALILLCGKSAKCNQSLLQKALVCESTGRHFPEYYQVAESHPYHILWCNYSAIGTLQAVFLWNTLQCEHFICWLCY